MIIKPSVRNNLFTNSHPLGCDLQVKKQFENIEQNQEFVGPKNALIIGGSSGYGLSSRISLAVGAKSNTINVSFESGPKGKRPGTAGYWNNVAFHKYVKKHGGVHKDFIGDAFSDEMIEAVSDYVKNEVGQIDLLIYSVASGARKNSKTGELVRSFIKTLGDDVVGLTMDIVTNELYELQVTSATPEEVDSTVYVMGGSNWEDWVTRFDQMGLLSNECKTISYTYIGGETTKAIYRGGTLGKAKEDLEATTFRLDKLLKEKYNGEALVSSSKAVATKASIYIPQMPIYVSCLYHVMIQENVHETIEEHKYRLFKDMVYGNQRIVDDLGRVRLDNLEMAQNIQDKTLDLMNHLDIERFFDLQGTKVFLRDLYQLNGFGFDEIDYDEDIDIEELDQDFEYVKV